MPILFVPVASPYDLIGGSVPQTSCVPEALTAFRTLPIQLQRKPGLSSPQQAPEDDPGRKPLI